MIAPPLAFVPEHNAPGKKDVTGAFLPEARAWARLFTGATIVRFDNARPPEVRRREVERKIREHCPGLIVPWIAFFCHGLRDRIQTGHAIAHVPSLAAEIAARDCYSVTLYACDTARDLDRDRADDMAPGPGGEGGFADSLRDAMPEPPALAHAPWIDAHTVTAHTTIAPFVRRFHLRGDRTQGGDWIVEPRSPLFGAWRRRLREDRTFRLSFPTMTEEAIRSALL